MWFNEDKAYKSGTFKLGQKVFHIKELSHLFNYHKECEYCDSTGKVLIKDKEFTCPNCNGAIITKEVKEFVVGKPVKIKSVISLKNKKNI